MSDEDAVQEVDGGAQRLPTPEEEFHSWVLAHFAQVEVTGSSQKAVWCPRWYDHPEVMARLRALWDAHDAAEARKYDEERPDMSAISDWWLRHWDAHRQVLFDKQNGPFRSCDMRQGHLYDATRDTVVAITPGLPGEERPEG